LRFRVQAPTPDAAKPPNSGQAGLCDNTGVHSGPQTMKGEVLIGGRGSAAVVCPKEGERLEVARQFARICLIA